MSSATLEIWGVRARAKALRVIQLLGLGLFVLGAYNFMAVPMYGVTPFIPHWELGYVFIQPQSYYVPSVVMMGLGAAIAWFA